MGILSAFSYVSDFGARMIQFTFWIVGTVLCSHAKAPDWAKGSVPEGRCFAYFKGIGEASSPSEARRRALEAALVEVAMNREVAVDARTRSIISERGGKVYEEFVREVLTSGKSQLIQGLKIVEEYTEPKGDSEVWYLLVRVPKVLDWRRCMEKVKGYGLRPLWRSALVPGWGQVYKGHRTKGKFLMIASLASASVSISAYVAAEREGSLALSSRREADREYHRDMEDIFRSVSLLSGVVAGGLYVYSLVDAAATPGKKIYALVPPSGPGLGIGVEIRW